MQPALFTWAFVAALLLSLGVKFWLATRQMRHVAAHRDQVPAAFSGTVTLPAHRKAADYTLAKGRFGLLTTAFGTAVLLGWTLLGGLDALNVLLRDLVPPTWPTNSRCWRRLPSSAACSTCRWSGTAPSASSSASASTA